MAFASILAASPAASSDPLAPPAFIELPELEPALDVWRQMAPSLRSSGRLRDADRLSFALLCYYVSEFLTAHRDIAMSGYSVMVKTISGSEMPRINRSVHRRDRALIVIMELAKRFGLTPLDRASLFKAHGELVPDDLFPETFVQRPSAAHDEKSKTDEGASPGDGWSDLLDGQAPLN